jgi:hypothetical protein
MKNYPSTRAYLASWLYSKTWYGTIKITVGANIANTKDNAVTMMIANTKIVTDEYGYLQYSLFGLLSPLYMDHQSWQ